HNAVGIYLYQGQGHGLQQGMHLLLELRTHGRFRLQVGQFTAEQQVKEDGRQQKLHGTVF
ncbi:MAG: hypothetical protein KDD94_06000, partial [Calditrichaeota bacterium]|nr:hypothetical protein [Calditrichota bacterium]